MRVGTSTEEQEFACWLRKLAKGHFNDLDDTVLLPPFLLCQPNSLSSLITQTYPNLSMFQNDHYFQERCILAPRHRDVHDINNAVLTSYPGQLHELWSIDEAIDPDTEGVVDHTYPPEVLHSACPNGFPLAKLSLKVGCPIIILCNLHAQQGICNGSRGIVTKIGIRILEVQLFSGQTVVLPQIKLICTDPEFPFHLHQQQFPVALAFAITINKAQGQSFTSVGIDLQLPCFSHGQLYVALSRGRSRNNVKCLLGNRASFSHTKNVVFREAIVPSCSVSPIW